MSKEYYERLLEIANPSDEDVTCAICELVGHIPEGSPCCMACLEMFLDIGDAEARKGKERRTP